MGYVYKLYFDNSLNEVYIGQTNQKIQSRITQHITDAKKNKSKKQKWITRNGRFKLKWTIIYIGDDLDHNEKLCINYYKEKGYVLYNSTTGGSGVGTKGYKHTLAEKKRRSVENPARDMSIYTFNNKNGDTFTGDRLAFKEYSKLTNGQICKLIKNKRITRDGWYEISANNINGNKKPKNNNVYFFVHEIYGSIQCTCYDLIQKYNLDNSKIYAVVKGKRNHHKGWFLNDIKHTTNPLKPICHNKPINMFNEQISKKYKSINDALLDLNKCRTSSHYIIMCCEGKRGSYLGYSWNYA